MHRILRKVAVTLVALTMVVGCSGCVSEEREAELVEQRETQLAELIAQADAWGAEIFVQVPEDEAEVVNRNVGGVRQASDHYRDWPKYYYWSQSVDLYADGPRSPEEFIDDLEPWLEEEGWERNRDREFPPGEDSFRRDYFRGPYHLVVEVYTVEPPKAQTIMFSIVTPSTDG